MGVTVLGTSPAYLAASSRRGVRPAHDHDLRALGVLGVTGSPLAAAAYHWVAEHVGRRVQLACLSGGTDVVTAFAGSAPNLPVWPGELSAPCLGVALDTFDASGRSVRGQVGELVVRRPLPSMPIELWGDEDGQRYHAAYFSDYPGVWRHGDWATFTARGSVIVHGRSDATLNRQGVRLGSADIYTTVERLPEVAEALVVGVEDDSDGYWMPLFVHLVPGAKLDNALRERIRSALRLHVGPRHVPDQILEAPGIPHTRTGKKLEVPVKRLLQGGVPEEVVDPGGVDDFEVLQWFAAQRWRSRLRHPATNLNRSQ